MTYGVEKPWKFGIYHLLVDNRSQLALMTENISMILQKYLQRLVYGLTPNKKKKAVARKDRALLAISYKKYRLKLYLQDLHKHRQELVILQDQRHYLLQEHLPPQLPRLNLYIDDMIIKFSRYLNLLLLPHLLFHSLKHLDSENKRTILQDLEATMIIFLKNHHLIVNQISERIDFQVRRKIM